MQKFVFKWLDHGYSYSPNHLKTRLFTIQKLFEIQQKCVDFEWSSFQIVETITIAKAWPFENQIWILNCQISDLQGISRFA